MVLKIDKSFPLRLARKINSLARAGQFSGAILIRGDRKEIFRRPFGFADRAWKVRNTPETRFRIASVGKMFTAAAVLQLVQAGKFSLETRIIEYLDLQGTTISPEITIDHLLTMTSGIADWINEDAQDFEAEWTAFCQTHPLYLLRRDADYLPIFSQLQPYAALGETFRYNNAGFMLLGLAIEKATGMPYFDYVRKEIFAPAGMTRTDFIDLDDVQPDVAEGYVPIQDADGVLTGHRKNIYSATAGAAADGGVTSTVDDLVRFSRALRTERFISQELVEAMLTPKVAADEEDTRWRYGFGCFILLDDRARILRWGHTGEEDGVSCQLYYYPAHRLDVVILGNQSSCAGKVASDIHGLITGAQG